MITAFQYKWVSRRSGVTLKKSYTDEKEVMLFKENVDVIFYHSTQIVIIRFSSGFTLNYLESLEFLKLLGYKDFKHFHSSSGVYPVVFDSFTMYQFVIYTDVYLFW